MSDVRDLRPRSPGQEIPSEFGWGGPPWGPPGPGPGPGPGGFPGWGWGPGGPWCPPGPGWDWNWRPPLGAIRGPIMGVTDGSHAKPGEVGEYIHFASGQPGVILNSSGNAVTITPLIVPPGDWIVEADWGCVRHFSSFAAWLDPVPAGAPANLGQVEMLMDPPATFGVMGAISPLLSLRISVPTLLAYKVNAVFPSTAQDFNGNPGQVSVSYIIKCWRVR